MTYEIFDETTIVSTSHPWFIQIAIVVFIALTVLVPIFCFEQGNSKICILGAAAWIICLLLIIASPIKYEIQIDNESYSAQIIEQFDKMVLKSDSTYVFYDDWSFDKEKYVHIIIQQFS